MKVPQYRAQTKLPAYGGGMLSAQASPSRMGSVGAAQAQMGATIANEAINWGTHFRKIEIATETAGHVETFRKERERVLNNAALQDVNTWMQGGQQQNYNDKRLSVENNLSNFMQRDILSKIKDKTIRRAVQTQLNADLISTMTQAKPLLQKRYLDFSRAESKKYLQGKALELAGMSHGSELYKAAWGRFKFEAQKYAALGNWSAEDVYKYTAGAEGSIQELRLNQDIINAQGNVDRLQEVYNNMRSIDPNTAAQYNKINPDRMLRITSQVQSDLEREKKAQTAKLIADENRDFINANRNQQTLYETTADKILARRIHDQTNPADRTGPVPPIVTVTDVRKLRLEPRQQSVLEDMITGAKDIINPGWVNKRESQIDEAVTNEDLDVLKKQVRADQLERRIGQKARTQLIKRIEDTRKKTPEAMKIKQLRKELKAATVKMDVETYGPVAIDGGPQQQSALHAFERNLELGQRPIEAFYNAYVDNVAQTKKEAISFLMKNVPAPVREALPALSKIPNLDTEDFARQDVNEIRQQIDNAYAVHSRQALGLRPDALAGEDLTTYKLTPDEVKEFQLNKNERVRVRQLYATERALNMLGRAYATFTPPDRPPPAVPDDPARTEQNDQSWWQGLFEDNRSSPPGVPQ
jgi:hypothetical protein